MRLLPYVAALSALAALAPACRRSSEAERRAADHATAAAEERAQETTITGATLEPNPESAGAFRLEQGDFRARLRRALDGLDAAVTKHRPAPGQRPDAEVAPLRTRRALLKGDLELLERSTEQDWAIVRAKLDRDLDTAQGPQLLPATKEVP